MKLGIDTGGTFTDFILQTDEGFKTYKVSSTPGDPSLAILRGLQYFFPDASSTSGFTLPSALEIVHGTTVGTNAFIQRKGAKTLLVTTKGFEDVLFIGRQNRTSLYDINIKRSPEIISRSQVLGVEERITATGEVEIPYNSDHGQMLCQYCRENGILSVAICLLHSYLNPVHEETIALELAELDLPVTISSQLLPEFREYERLSTTLINAYLAPIVSEYINKLSNTLEPNSLSIQQSSGGILPAEGIAKRAVQTVLSGPAGGVHGAYRLAREMGIDKIITFDMGGTSTDVSLCDKGPTLTRDYSIDGFPIRTQVIDIHTVGAGGGSIANVDAGGLLHVGPESAGADPGPVCYGKGNRITVTDVNLYLGRLLADKFLGGEMSLHYSKVEEKLAHLAQSLSLTSVETALGILRIVNIGMVKAVRAVSLERGYDPKEFALFSFGGASGLHCCDMASELGISKIIIPDRAGILSAQGMVMSEPTLDSSKSLFLTGDDIITQNMESSFSEMEEKLTLQMQNLCHDGTLIIERFLDLRYKGQSYEISVIYSDNFREEFHASHEHHFGYKLPDIPLELVSIRSTVKIKNQGYIFPRHTIKKGHLPEEEGRVSITFEGGKESVPVYQRRSLSPGNSLQGPALIIDNYTTILVQFNFDMTIDSLLNIVLKPHT
jgi:N-methylhydantoinase A